MRKIILIVLLFLPFAFSFAQEAGTQGIAITEQAAENDPETEDITAGTEAAEDEGSETEAGTDAVSSASWTPQRAAEEVEEELSFLERLIIALAIVAGQIFLIWLIWLLFKRLENRLENTGKNIIKPLVIKKFQVLTARQIVKTLEVFLRILKYIITALQLFLTIPIIFSLFEATKNLASTLFGYILNPLKNIALGAIGYIPNLFTIAIIIIITHYVLKGLKFFADQIKIGKLKIPGFYTDWAAPTYKIFQVLLWAFTVAIIYPYLPGSDSRAFQGVSVFVGVIFSLGSSTAIGNLVAGIVITYMRPFKIGDRVMIKEITGFVVEKNLMVVRLKTHKNEYVTFPNLIILGSNIINYNTSCDEDEEGLIIFSEVTLGYSIPWQTIHDILVNAALNTDYIQKRPKPFVLQTKLDDYYACYQINCYTKDVSKVPQIYTLLYENIQNGFKESGIDLTSAHYRIISANKE
ncbi:MAG: mechanosensitive ion channel family protein [Treponema sp.]|nr:mechanosensitive ion channel family protein [Treponema sp.]